MKENEYKQIYIETDCGDVIGEIIIKDNNFIHARITGGEYISRDINDINELRKFLDIVEQKMKECQNTKIYFD